MLVIDAAQNVALKNFNRKDLEWKSQIIRKYHLSVSRQWVTAETWIYILFSQPVHNYCGNADSANLYSYFAILTYVFHQLLLQTFSYRNHSNNKMFSTLRTFLLPFNFFFNFIFFLKYWAFFQQNVSNGSEWTKCSNHLKPTSLWNLTSFSNFYAVKSTKNFFFQSVNFNLWHYYS